MRILRCYNDTPLLKFIGIAKNAERPFFLWQTPTIGNKCSDRSMEMKLSALLGNYDRPTPTTDQLTDRPGQRKVSLPIRIVNWRIWFLICTYTNVCMYVQNIILTRNKLPCFGERRWLDWPVGDSAKRGNTPVTRHFLLRIWWLIFYL